MNPTSPWIAALAEQCLSFYLGHNDQHEIQVEDVDGCLCFSGCKLKLSTAIIVSWTQGDNSQRATFTDSQNQVDAIISNELLDIPDGKSPCPPSIKGGPRHLIELSDIKLMFTYSTPSPDIYLKVNRFEIHPNAVSKGDVPKPKLKKTPGIRNLITAAYRKCQQSCGHFGSNGQPNNALADSFASQHDIRNHPENKVSSQLLHSQCPSNVYHGARKASPPTNRASFGASSDLLGHLVSSRSIEDSGPTTNDLKSSQGLSLDESNTRQPPLRNERASSTLQEHDKSPAPKQSSSRRFFSNTTGATCNSNLATSARVANLYQQVDNLILEVTSQAAQPPTGLNDDSRAPMFNGMNNQQPSKKRSRGSTDTILQAAHDDDLASQAPQNAQSISPSKKRQRTDARVAIPHTTDKEIQIEPVPAPLEVQIASTKTDPMRLFARNPWEGMERIPSSEIHIPKEQADLLEDLNWIPQDPGVSAPLCHVPPRLLTQWNDITRRNQCPAEAEEEYSQRSPSPTQQELHSSPLEWSQSIRGSPIRGSPQNVLPPDRTPPPRKTRATKESPEPCNIELNIDQITDNDGVDMRGSTNSALSQPGQEGTIALEEKLLPTAEQSHQPFEKVTQKPKDCDSMGYRPKPGQSEEGNTSRSLDSIGGQPLNTVRQCSQDQITLETPFGHVPSDKSSDDEDDDIEMETTVPFAFGGSLPLSSQPEQVITSSGPSFPTVAVEMIQVTEAPAVNIPRLKPEKQTRQRAGHSLPTPQQSSSEAAKTSSISRVLNTYRSQGSHGNNDVSQETLDPSSIAEDESLQVDVLGTQTELSGLRAPSPITIQSASEVVLDSSRPAQRQRDSFIFHLDPSDDPSSLPYDSSHSLPMSQLNERSQDSSGILSSLDGSSQIPELSPKEFTPYIAAHVESPSKLPRLSRSQSNDINKKLLHNEFKLLVQRRQSFINKPEISAEAQRIYEKFCNDYSLYSGDFAHFAEMCSKLQTMRERGQLQRSFLWDDFIIQNLVKYPHYFAEYTSQDLKAMEYEEYFCMNFSRPQHKKRSLTAHGINLVASQLVPPTSARLASPPVTHQVTDQGDVVQDCAAQSGVGNTSPTASTVGTLSKPHARSSAEIDLGDVINVGINMPTVTQSSSFPSTATDSGEVEIKLEDNSSDVSSNFETSSSSTDQSPMLESRDKEVIDSNLDNILTAPYASDIDMGEAGTDELDETGEVGGTHHETASIEISDDIDDRRISASPAPPAALGALHFEEPDPPRQRKSWFRSLEHIFPTGPVWSDDPDTPFKQWARQDQNILQEIKRRGGTRVQVNEKGLICRPTYNRPKNLGS